MIYVLGCLLFICNATSASDSSWWCCYKKTDTRPQAKNASDDYQIFYDSNTPKDQRNTTTHNPIAKRSLDQSKNAQSQSAIQMHQLQNVVSNTNSVLMVEETNS